MYEIIGTYKDDFGHNYTIERKVTEVISISLMEEWRNKKTLLSNVQFRNIGREYTSPLLSWYNLFFCSNYYGCAPDYEYMHQAVQNGRKTAATVYIEPESPEGLALIRQLPLNCDSMPYDNNMIYVFHKGCLKDFFDYDDVKYIYTKNNIYLIDWARVSKYFEMPLLYFGHEKRCGFSLQNGGDTEQMIVKGLILGYPVESTVELLRKE